MEYVIISLSIKMMTEKLQMKNVMFKGVVMLQNVCASIWLTIFNEAPVEMKLINLLYFQDSVHDRINLEFRTTARRDKLELKVDLYDLVIFDHFCPSDWRGNRDEFWSNSGNSR